MYSGLIHAHSGFRWIVLVLLLITIINAFGKRNGAKPWTVQDQKLALYTFISTHIQLLFGLILYFISPKVQFAGAAMKDKILRFFTVEHSLLMLIAIALITIGYLKAKKAPEGKKAKTIFTYFLIALILIIIRIPWPFMGVGGNWF
jgi:membrane-associated HD superfamily phosphohydrolase